MLRPQLAALAAAALLTIAPAAVHAQLVPLSPLKPRIVLRPDLIAIVDQSTRIIFVKQSMRIDPSGATGLRPIVDFAQCAGLAEGQRRAVAVPPLKWGVGNGFINAANPVGGTAQQFTVTLSYQTVSNGLVADQTDSKTVDVLASGTQRFFSFTHPLRVAQYEVTLFKEPARTPAMASGGGAGTVSGQIRPPEILRTFCVPSVEAIDHAMVVTVDAAAQVDDSNRSNNVLRLP